MYYGSSLILGALIGLVVFGAIGVLVGRERGWSPIVAFLLGALLGVIGVIIMLVVDRRPKENLYAQQQQWNAWSQQQQWQNHQADWAQINSMLPPGWVLDSPRFNPQTGQWNLMAYDPREQPGYGGRQRQITVFAPTQDTLWGNMIVALRAGPSGGTTY